MKIFIISLLLILSSANLSYGEDSPGWWRLELKTLKCIQESYSLGAFSTALSVSGNPCTPIGDSTKKNSFVMIQCSRTGTNYILAPTKQSCEAAEKKLKPIHASIKNTEGKSPFVKKSDK